MAKKKKEREVKEVLKNEDKPYKFWTTTKKIFAGIIVAVIVAGAAIGLAVGLKNLNNPTPTPPGPGIEQPDNPGGEITPPGGGDEGEIKPDPGPGGGDEGEIKPNPGPGEGEEKPDPGPGGGDEKPEVIENIADLIANHGSTVYNALDDAFRLNAAKSIFGRKVDESKLGASTWYLGEGDEINEIKYAVTYNRSNTSYTYGVATIKLENGIFVKGMEKEDIQDAINAVLNSATFESSYGVGYNPSIQAEKKELTDALCDKFFTQAEGEKVLDRYIVDEGPTTDSQLETTVRQFKVIQISNYQVKEIGVRIKDPSASVDEFINKLNDESNYRTYDYKDDVKFLGNKLEEAKVNLTDYVLEMPDGSFFEMF